MGLAVAKKLLSSGWKVTIVDYNQENGQKVSQELGGEDILFVQANVADYEQCAKAFVKTWNKWHRLDAFYGNAVSINNLYIEETD